VPAVLLGEAEQKVNEQHAKGREQSSVRILYLQSSTFCQFTWYCLGRFYNTTFLLSGLFSKWCKLDC
jgi:hypothetical protein